MDIHPPEHPIRSVRDFLLQIFTITCGILIALGLEQVVEWRRGEALARHARQDFRAEMAENRRRIVQVLAAEPALEQSLNEVLAYTQAQLDHTPPPKVFHPLPDGRIFLRLTGDAWESAVATQAVLHLRPVETHALLAAYTAQRGLNEISAQAIERWVGLTAFGDEEKLPEPELRRLDGEMRVAFAYARSVANGARGVEKAYDEAEAALAR